MIKTYVDIPRRDHIYYMVHDIITMRNGWDVITTVTRPDHIRIYFSYKWFQYGKVLAFKKAVKRFEKRNKWYYKPSIYADDFTKKTAFSTEQYKKALEEFANTTFIQGGIRCGDIEDIANDDGIVIGYKR